VQQTHERDATVVVGPVSRHRGTVPVGVTCGARVEMDVGVAPVFLAAVQV
jgi:hypothetical protein